jgi:hypothetical protein
VGAARRADPSFNLTDALRELLDDGLIVGAISPTTRPC